MAVSVIIPTYNEKENISILIPSIENVLKKIKHEIIVVDDSSPDGTAKEAERLNNKYGDISVVLRKKKQGIGAALIDGYNYAKNDIIVSLDSDLSFEVKDILRLLDKINEGYDLVVGSRHIIRGSYEMKKFDIMVKGMVSRFGNKLNTLFTGIPIHDFTANFRAIRNDVWKAICTKDKTNFILAEMIIRARYSGYKVTEIPVTFQDRIYGKSKLNLAREIPKFIFKLSWMSLIARLKSKRNVFK